MPEGVAAGVRESINRIGELRGNFSDKSSEINSSNELTLAGKQKKYQELGFEVVKALAVIEAENQGYNTRINQLTKEMVLPKSSEPDILSYLRERELRDHLYKLDPVELEALYKSAISENTVDIIDAIQNAPRVSPLVSVSLIDGQKSQRLTALFPKEAEEVNMLETAKGLVTGAIVAVKSSLEKERVTFPIDDPIKHIAQGGN